MTTGIRKREDSGGWESAAGRTFVEALNDGLARAGSSRARPLPQGQRALSDPFAAAVMREYEAALPAALPPDEREDPALRFRLLNRGRELLVQAEALLFRRPPGHPHPHGELPAAHETVARTLLLECAALLVVEGREARGSRRRPTDLIRALGQTARRAPGPEAPRFPPF
ncbi:MULTISPECIES: hypothetical protein [unclassified Streptomyces]|uniref:hypothetical protein n=1 Tax=unclassified Streptomyces TaxID=2593676 RepID=UPI00332208C8